MSESGERRRRDDRAALEVDGRPGDRLGTARVVRSLLTSRDIAAKTALDALLVIHEVVARLRVLHSHTHVDMSAEGSGADLRITLVLTDDAPRSWTGEVLTPEIIAMLGRRTGRWGVVSDPTAATLWFEFGNGTWLRRDRRSVPDALGLVTDVADVVRTAEDFADGCDRITSAVRRRVSASLAAIVLCSGGRDDVVSVDPAALHGLPDLGNLFAPGSALSASFAAGEPIIVSTAEQLTLRFPDLAEVLAGHDIRAVILTPLFDGDRLFGAIVVGWSTDRPVETYRRILDIVTAQVGMSLGHLARVQHSTPSLTIVPAAAVDEGVSRRLVIGGVDVDLVSREALIGGRRAVRLTGREFELLVHLMRHADRVQSRAALLHAVWGIDFAADTAVVDVTMSRLRRKLASAPLATIKDAGYVFRGAPARD